MTIGMANTSFKMQNQLLITISIATLVLVKGLGNINPLGPTMTAESAQCLLSLIRHNFKKPGLVIVAATFNVSVSPVANIRTSVLQHIHRQLTYSVEVVSPDDEDSYSDNQIDDDETDKSTLDDFTVLLTGDYYVLVVQGFSDFKKVVQKLVTLRNWSSRAKFVIFCYRFFDRGFPFESYPEKMLTYLFKHKVVWAVVAIPHIDDYRLTMVYGWKPYDPPTYCGHSSENATGRLIVENRCFRGKAEHNKEILNRPLPLIMKGCELRAIALLRHPFVNDEGDEFVGIERMLLNEIVKELDFKMNVTILNKPRGEKDKFGNWNNALSMLQAGECDILFGGIFPDNDVHEDFEASAPYLTDSYTWVVPKAQQVPTWAAPVIIFQYTVWLSALCTLFISVFFWASLGKLSGDSRRNTNIGHCFLNAWCTTFGFCGYMQPMKQSLRLFFIFFNIYCILFLTAYQTKLIDVLKYPSFQRQVQSAQELVEGGVRWGGARELHDIYEGGDALDSAIERGYVDVTDSRRALLDVAVHNNFSVIFSRVAMSYLSAEINELNDEYGNHDFYLFETNELTTSLEVVSARGFPFVGRLNFMVGVLGQAGAVVRAARWYSAATERRRARLLRPLRLRDGTQRPLTLRHLQGGWYALALGAAGDVLLLLLERTLARSSKRLQTQLEAISLCKARISQRCKW